MRSYVRHRFEVLDQVGVSAFQVLISEILVNPDLRARYAREILDPTFATADAALQRSGADNAAAHDQKLKVRAQAALVLGACCYG